MLKPSSSITAPFTGLAAGVFLSLGLVGCGDQSEPGMLSDSIEQISQASEVAIPSEEGLDALMAEDQIAARRSALKTAEAGLKNVMASGTPQEQKAARLLLTRVRIADADAAITQVRAGVPAVIANSSAVRTQALGFEAAFNQVVRLDPKIEGYLTIMAAAVLREEQAAAAVAKEIKALEESRSQLRAKSAEHQEVVKGYGKAKAGLARQLMGAEGREAFIIQNAMSEMTFKINAEQAKITVLADQVRLVEDQIALSQTQVEAAEHAVEQYSQLSETAKQNAAADTAARDAFRQTLNDAGAQVAESLKAMVDAYGVNVHTPLGDVLEGLKDATGTDTLGEVEIASARLEALVVDAMALQTVVDTLKAVKELSGAGGSSQDAFGTVGPWRADALSAATGVADEQLAVLGPALEKMRGAALELATATREQLSPMRGEGDDAQTQAANNYFALVSLLGRSVQPAKG